MAAIVAFVGKFPHINKIHKLGCLKTCIIALRNMFPRGYVSGDAF